MKCSQDVAGTDLRQKIRILFQSYPKVIFIGLSFIKGFNFLHNGVKLAESQTSFEEDRNLSDKSFRKFTRRSIPTMKRKDKLYPQ